jgi:DNA-binding NarL/FixJ family response regulator
MKIAIAEDHLMTRDFVRKVCLQDKNIQVVAEASTGREAVEQIVRTKPDLIVLDIELPDIDGFEVLARVRKHGVRPRVLVLSCHGSPYIVFRLERSGVHGFVDKCAQTADTLRFAIKAIRSNQTYFSRSFIEIRASRHLDPLAFDKLLTDQQMQVLSLVAHLDTDQAIARNLAITERTVETHRTAIMRKLGLHSRTDLIRYAKVQGFTFGSQFQAASGMSGN